MTLPASGAISLGQVNTELGLAATTNISLNQTNVRTLAGVASGTISLSNLYGKTYNTSWSGTISTNQANLNLRAWAVSAGWNGTSAAVITINAGVYVYGTVAGAAALTIDGAWPGGITLINNGYVIGLGGNGGKVSVAATAGNTGISLGVSCTITNNSYICGGGGGGSGTGTTIFAGGGGGAGGGLGGGATTGGGGVGAAGSGGSGAIGACGGRVLPGTGGAGAPTNGAASGGGGAGGGGASMAAQTSPILRASFAGGGGGGWGARGGGHLGSVSPAPPTYAGGAGGSSNNVGANAASGTASTTYGAGGNAVKLNGFSVTWNATGTRWGAIA